MCDSSGGLREAWVESLRALSRGFTSIKESFDIESSVTMLSSCFLLSGEETFPIQRKTNQKEKKMILTNYLHKINHSDGN